MTKTDRIRALSAQGKTPREIHAVLRKIDGVEHDGDGWRRK